MNKEPKENVANNVAQREMQDLTEKWKNGTLKTGSYYIRIITGNEKSDYFEGKKFCFWSDYEVEEVLAPVPSYKEFFEDKKFMKGLGRDYSELMNQKVELLKKIEELTTKCSQLEQENAELVQKMHILNEANMNLENTVGKFGEQLNEANKVIKHYANGTIYLFPTWCNGSFEANNYLEKWGVK